MKDEWARDETQLLRKKIEDYGTELVDLAYKLSHLKGLVISDCPKCGHPALAQKSLYDIKGKHGICPSVCDCCRCLTCGTRFTCSEKCV